MGIVVVPVGTQLKPGPAWKLSDWLIVTTSSLPISIIMR